MAKQNYTCTYTISSATPFTPSATQVCTVLASSVAVSANNPPPGLPVVTDASTAQNPAMIKVARTVPGQGQANVSIGLKITDSNSALYYPVGIGIKVAGTVSGGRPSNFPSTGADGDDPTQLNITDKDISASTYDFVVLFQDANGNFGVLDPWIVNNN